MVRLSFYEPGGVWDDPYFAVQPPLSRVPDGIPVLLGGELTVLRGGFSEGATLKLSAPVPFHHMDWVRVWLDGDDDDLPTYLGEIVSDPWTSDGGTVTLRGLTARLQQSRWVGRAEGTFKPFLEAVLGRAVLPPGVTVGPLPSLSMTFKADTPFELIGDTFASITPALGGYLLGVDNRARIVAIEGQTDVRHRFPRGTADTPVGQGSYANCVRFSFEYPSGDTGWFEGMNDQEITVRGKGEVWDVVTVTAKEVGVPNEPYRNIQGTATTTIYPGGKTELYRDSVLRGDILDGFSLTSLNTPQISHIEGVTSYPSSPEARQDLDLRLAGRLITPSGLVNQAREAQLRLNPNAGQGDAKVQVYQSRLEVVLHMTGMTSFPVDKVLQFGFDMGGGAVNWVTPATDGGIATHNGEWEGVSQQADCYRFMLPPMARYPNDATNIRIAYTPAYRDSVLASGRTLLPITFRGGGRLHIPLPMGDSVSYSPVTLPDDRDSTQIQVIVRRAGTTEAQLTLPFPMFTATYTPENDPVQALSEKNITSGTFLLDLDQAISLVPGSSIEVQLLEGGSLSKVFISTLFQDDAARQYSAVNKGGFAESVITLALQDTPVTAISLPAGEKLDEWARFKVQGNLNIRRVILQGAINVGKVRIRVPQLDTLNTYGSELLRYRSSPAKEWTGRYSTLKWVDPQGVAAFEVVGEDEDALLDVQRVIYDLDNMKVSVVAGTPLPATDEDAVVGRIERIERAQRRAGGA